MIKIAKYLVYVLIAILIYGLFWFLPKYSYVQRNPGYCANLTKHLYYCGTQADLKAMFEATRESKTIDLPKDIPNQNETFKFNN